jgi:hypothetical protein
MKSALHLLGSDVRHWGQEAFWQYYLALRAKEKGRVMAAMRMVIPVASSPFLSEGTQRSPQESFNSSYHHCFHVS